MADSAIDAAGTGVSSLQVVTDEDRSCAQRAAPAPETTFVDVSTGAHGQRKRRRRTGTTAATASYTRRKRAVAACQFCRLRKAKCDNGRPVCGFCRHHHARCIYDDGPPPPPPDEQPRQDIDEAEATAAVDGESLLETNRRILHRLGQIEDMLHALPQQQQQQQQHSPATQSNTQRATSDRDSHHWQHRPLLAQSPYAATRCESVLRWPVFEGVIPESERRIESFVLIADSAKSGSPSIGITQARGPGAATALPGIQEELLIPLCRKFLLHIHPRNPILESDQLIAYAKDAAENGLKWNASSCLVLLACALACRALPWEAHTYTSESIEELIDRNSSAHEIESQGKAMAEAFMLAAKKRIGLLESSMIDIQCFFFASIYEKYCLRPLQSWFYIQQASSRLQSHLLEREQGNWMSAGSLRSSTHDHLKSRLFWSCYKAETELLPDIGRRPSGLDDYAFLDAFPALPTSLTGDPSDLTTSPCSDMEQRAEEERSWLFYLAEISLRRTINDNLQILYRRGQVHWTTDTPKLIQQHWELEKQVSLWYSHLPSSIRFERSKLPENELAFYLQGRFLEWREYILRPFIFCALHQPPGHPCETPVLALAQEGIEVLAELVVHHSYNHRHGGTWFCARQTFLAGMVLAAAVLRAGKLQLPPNLPSLIKLALATLDRLAPEATDIGMMASTLRDTCSGLQCGLHLLLEASIQMED